MTQLDAPETAANGTGTPAEANQPPESPTSDESSGSPAGPKRRRRLGRRSTVLLIGAVALLLGGAGYGAWVLFFSGRDEATTQYRTMTVTQETVKSTVSATGTLNPAKESELSFGSSGEVTKVLVEVGDKVGKGEVLARINDDELQIDYDAAKAELAESEDSLDELIDNGDATDTAIASAKAGVKVKENAVKRAEAALEDATLVAPFGGTIAAVGIEKGDSVGSTSGSAASSGSSGSSGSNGSTGSSSSSESITLISTGTYVVDSSVSTTDLASIKKGLQATITPTGSDQPVFGTVSSVGVVASSSASSSSSGSGGSSGGSATFPVTIAVTGKHTDLLPGSSATVDITVKQLADVISVPTQAISTVDGKTVVQKLVDGSQVQSEVTIGQVVGASTVITKGLNDGDEVVVASFTAAAGTGTRSGNRGQEFDSGGSGGFPGGGTFQGQGGPPNGGGLGDNGGGTGSGGNR